MRCTCLVILFLAVQIILAGQSPGKRTFTIQDGLSQMKVSCLHHDSRGYLWVGTRNGLNRFNGETFEIYTTEDGLPTDRILDITENARNHIVILTSGGICVFDGAVFRSYPHEFLSVIYTLALDNQGAVWIQDCTTGSLMYFNAPEYREITELGVVGSIGYDSMHQVMLAVSERGLYRYDTSDWVQILSLNQVVMRAPYGHVDDLKVVGLGIRSGFRFAGYNATGLEPLATYSNDGTWENLRPNGIWYPRDLRLYLPGPDSAHMVIENMPINVTDVYRDRLGQFWIGSDNGLTQIYAPDITHYPLNVLPNVWSVVEDASGTFWFSGYGSGLYNWPADAPLPRKLEVDSLISDEFLLGASQDDSGALYFSNTRGLLKYLDGRFTKALGTTCYTVHYDSNLNQLVLGTQGGIRIWSPASDSTRYIGVDDGIHVNNYIQHITIDREGCYWLGSYSGISRYCPSTGGIRSYTPDNGRLPCEGVFAAVQHRDGPLWFGGDKGLMYYSFETDSIRLVESHVLSGLVKSLMQFDSIYLLAGAKNGLYLFDTHKYLESGEKRFFQINTTTGYQGIEPGFNGLYRDSKGQIWITSATSLDRLDPSTFHFGDQALGVQILSVDGSPVPFDHPDSTYSIAFGKNSAAITFEGVGFARPALAQYQYRINGAEWSPWKPENQVILNDLEEGRYLFEVRAGPTDLAPRQDRTDQVHFSVDLAFYQSPYFPVAASALACILLGLTLYYFFQQRRALQRYAAQLEEAKYLRSQLLLTELNPHFIFNVLASIQNKIITGQKETASRYIVKLSKLIRNFLNASYKGNIRHGPEYEIPLAAEIELLRAFVEFEREKNDDHFDFHFVVDDSLNPENVMIPPMLLQPFVENSIKHGLLLRDAGGHLNVKFAYFDEALVCTIEDDGVGMEASRRMRESAFQTHKSLGSKIVAERVDLLNELGYAIAVSTEDRTPCGTKVTVRIKEAEL